MAKVTSLTTGFTATHIQFSMASAGAPAMVEVFVARNATPESGRQPLTRP